MTFKIVVLRLHQGCASVKINERHSCAVG